MKINIDRILELQKQLDNNIHTKHNINPKEVFEKRRLALIVEICEMINVNRCFKFWSLKKDYDKQVLGDEFVDCLHFILSISLHFDLDQTEYEIKDVVYDDNELTLRDGYFYDTNICHIDITEEEDEEAWSKDQDSIDFDDLYQCILELVTKSYDNISSTS